MRKVFISFWYNLSVFNFSPLLSYATPFIALFVHISGVFCHSFLGLAVFGVSLRFTESKFRLGGVPTQDYVRLRDRKDRDILLLSLNRKKGRPSLRLPHS